MVDYDENDTFKVQVLQAMSSLIIAAFSLVAALAWNEAIKYTIGKLFEDTEMGEMAGLYVYAVLVTIIAVVMSILITKAIRKAKAIQKKN
ncbi:MAG: DUF5654 family protein [archaeon]|nr:DUF5654 family protein [archaeon]